MQTAKPTARFKCSALGFRPADGYTIENKMTNTQKSIGLMWSVVGVTTLYISLNIYFFAHGSEFFLPIINLEKTDYHSASFYGVFFTLPLVLTTHYLTRIYAENYTKMIWYYNFPVAFNRELSELKSFLKSYQIFFFVCILILPSLLHIDYFNKFFHGTVYLQDTSEPVLVAWQQFTFDFSIYDHGVNNFRFGDTKIGIDYYPIFFPVAIVIAEIVHVWSLIITLFSIGIFQRNNANNANNAINSDS